MKYYDDRSQIVQYDFYRLKISASPEIRIRVQSILKNLNIPRKKWINFNTDLSIYNFLLQLARDGHPQVTYLIDLIEEKEKFSKLQLAITGSIFFSFIACLLPQPTFSFIIEGIKTLLSSVTTIPILGLISSVGLSLYYFYDIYYDGKKTEFNRWRDSAFLLISSSANIAAHLLLIITYATASPIVGGLYVAAAIVDVIKEAFCLVQEYKQYLNSPPIDENDHLSVHRDYARRVFGFEKRRNALGINLAAALLLVAITAIWCFLPGGLPVTIAAFAVIGLIYVTKQALLKWNEDRLREHLQGQLAELEQNYDNPLDEVMDELDVENQPETNLSYAHTQESTREPDSLPLERRRQSSLYNATSPAPALNKLFFFNNSNTSSIDSQDEVIDERYTANLITLPSRDL